MASKKKTKLKILDYPIDDKDITLTEMYSNIETAPNKEKALNDFLNTKESINRVELLANRDYNYLYPSLDDPNFNVKIAEKKEFYDTKIDITVKNIEEEANKICNVTPELAPHQQFVKNFLSFQTPYNSLLLYHGLGTGKTCAAISVAEEQRSYLKQLNINQRIIIVASPNVQENFKLQLFDEKKLDLINGHWNIKNCVGNNFLREINPINLSGLSKEKVVKQIKNIINSYYLFLGYIEFANYILKSSTLKGDESKKMAYSKLKRQFNNRLIIIDEVHNIRISDDNQNKRVAQELIKLVKNVDNLRLLFLSATPMYNSYKEIIWLINLMNLNDKRSQISIKDVFDDNGNFLIKDGKEIGKELLERKATGYISYVKGENPYSFPYKIWPKEFSPQHSFENLSYPKIQLNNKNIIQPLEHISVYIKKIGGEQEKIYNYIINQLKNSPSDSTDSRDSSIQDLPQSTIPNFNNMESFGYIILQKPLEALNIIYPLENIDELISNQDYNFDSKLLVGKGGLNRIMKYTETTAPPSRFNFEYNTLKYGKIFSPELIGNYSSKIKTICENIINSEGIVLIYSQYIDGGVVPIALALEELGFTRHGKVKSLFKTPPTEPLDVKTYLPKSQVKENFKPAKYIMITGDKYLSPDNNADIKAVTDIKNNYGDEVKVVLISQAGSEGIDFKFIRQVHILEPWYNMNRIEQIIGRGVRTCSHKDLPFIERNVEIFLHGTLLSNEQEAADLYVYRLAELKALQIGRVSRVLKEVSVDCLLNISQNNFSEDIINQTVKQKLSNKMIIDYKVGDKPYSATCDYLSRCNYTCNPNKEITSDDVSILTYTEPFIITNNEKIIERIKKIMKENYFYTKQELIPLINLYKTYPLLQIDSALTQMINDKSEFLVDKYDRLGHLINIDELYLFQPIELTNPNISIYDRSVPINYKREKLLLESEKKELDEEILLAEKDEIIKKLLDDIEDNYNKAITEQLVMRGEKDYYKFMSLVINNLSTEEISREELNFFVVQHILELLDFNNTMLLLNYLYFNKLTEFEEILKIYYDNIILSAKKIQGILLSNNNKQQLVILDKSNWKLAESEDYEDLSEKLKELIIPTNKLNNIVGFIGDFKNLFNIFKVKNLDKKRNKGARCDQASKSDSIKLLNLILQEDLYTISNTKTMNHIEICIYQEIYLRYFNLINKDDKIWFLNPGEAIINNIETRN